MFEQVLIYFWLCFNCTFEVNFQRKFPIHEVSSNETFTENQSSVEQKSTMKWEEISIFSIV